MEAPLFITSFELKDSPDSREKTAESGFGSEIGHYSEDSHSVVDSVKGEDKVIRFREQTV